MQHAHRCACVWCRGWLRSRAVLASDRARCVRCADTHVRCVSVFAVFHLHGALRCVRSPCAALCCASLPHSLQQTPTPAEADAHGTPRSASSPSRRQRGLSHQSSRRRPTSAGASDLQLPLLRHGRDGGRQDEASRRQTNTQRHNGIRQCLTNKRLRCDADTLHRAGSQTTARISLTQRDRANGRTTLSKAGTRQGGRFRCVCSSSASPRSHIHSAQTHRTALHSRCPRHCSSPRSLCSVASVSSRADAERMDQMRACDHAPATR